MIVAELVPAIVRWNRQETGSCTGWPLEDSRVTVWEGDVGALLAARGGGFHAVILDVDNGPEALSWTHNAKLYGDTGIASIRSALAPGGVLAVWAAEIDEPYEGRLEDQGFRVRRLRVPARGHSDGVRHVIYLAQSNKEEEIG